jgi:hypothetical protein
MIKNISLIIILLSITLTMNAQSSADNIVAFKLYFKDKLVDSVKAKEFQILSEKGEKNEKTGQPVDYSYEGSCQCFVYNNYSEGIPGITIVHVIDTMEIKLPPFLVYFEKVPFQKGKFLVKGEGADVGYDELNNFKDQLHAGKKLPFSENLRFRNYSLYSWGPAKVSTPKK